MTFYIIYKMSFPATIDNLIYNLNNTGFTATVADNRSNNNYPPNLTIPNTVDYNGSTYTVADIEANAFAYETRLTSVVLPTNTVFYRVETGVFKQTSISQITIPNNIRTIGAYSFQDCKKLTTVNIDPANSLITRFQEFCFAGCNFLTSIVIPRNTNTIYPYAFVSCNTLSQVYFYAPIIPIGYTNGQFGNIASNATAYYVNGTDITKLQTNTNNPLQPIPNNWFTNYVILNPPCFKEDTLILTNKGYRRIQELRKGDLVKTLLNGFLKIDMIGKKNIYHKARIEDRIKNQLYKCSHEKFNEVFEPLVLTGCHSILVDEFVSEEQKKQTIEVNGDTYVTDRKYRLPACLDERTTVYEIPGTYTIYHLALENPDYYMNYGIYANGLLVETSSRRYLKELSGMELIE